jgi:hypothetical protein
MTRCNARSIQVDDGPATCCFAMAVWRTRWLFVLVAAPAPLAIFKSTSSDQGEWEAQVPRTGYLALVLPDCDGRKFVFAHGRLVLRNIPQSFMGAP